MKIQTFTKIFILIIAIAISEFVNAQSITLDPNSATAIVDAKSTNKGALLPRMTVLQRNSIPLSIGLQVYCNDCSPEGPYYYNGSTWIAMFQKAIGVSTTYSVGQAAQGGVIFWIDATGQHGLVVANADQTTAIWFNGSTNTKAIRAGIYGGAFNTNQILQSIGYGNFAASVAAQYQDGVIGYGDWYLPSKNELKLLFSNQGAIGMSFTGAYWSSTEQSVSQGQIADSAFQVDLSTGTESAVLKSITNKIRAIRSF